MLTALLYLLLAVPHADTLHTQTVAYEVSPVHWYPGTLTLTNEGIHFQASNERKQHRSFSLNYADIYRVKKLWWYLFPSRTLIQTRDGKRYTIYTYRRQKIIHVISAKINRKK